MNSRIELLLECPKCHNKMKYAPQGKALMDKRKRCVYCGHSYMIGKNIASD